ncbi:TraR/DksA family transcriptional regulator [Chloroflexota bacterium]
MTSKHKELRSRLEDEQKHLIEELEQIRISSQPSDERREGSPFGKREEEATETLELEKRLTIEQRVSDLLASVEHALQKFEDGTYGICDDCGNKIDPDRLEALPRASVCMKCKAEQAKNAKAR